MKIVAITKAGREYAYKTASAHRVSARSAERIAQKLTEVKYGISDDEIWFVYDIDKYDTAYDFAELQEFKVVNGCLKERRSI